MTIFYDPDKIISWEGEILEVVEPTLLNDEEVPDYIRAEGKARSLFEFRNQDLEVVYQDTHSNILVEGCIARRNSDNAPVKLIFQRWSDNRITIIVDDNPHRED
jgi:hypothetical protein